MQTHLEHCEYDKIDCPNKCKAHVMRIDLDKHLIECPLRLEACDHCAIEIVATQMVRHHLVDCPKFPVKCPVCGEVEVMRETINAHVNIINGKSTLNLIDWE